MTKLDTRFPMSISSHSGIPTGAMSRVRNTTVGYRPTHTAIDVLKSEGGGSALSPNENQLPNEWSIVLSV